MFSLPKAFCALQCLAPASGDRVNNPVPLLFTNNEILFFQDTEMVGKFGVSNVDDTLDDTDAERLGEKSIHDREPDGISECLVDPAGRLKCRCIRYSCDKTIYPSLFIEIFLYGIREIF